jgi:membrane-bound ClpP family serine protease
MCGLFFGLLPAANRPALAAPTARLVRIPIPIVGNVDSRVIRSIQQVLEESEASTTKRPVLVLEFWPSENATDAGNSEFERCLALARFLVGPKMSRVRTVAYLPRTVVGHAVLPVIACEEIIAHPDAELGDAGRGETDLSMTIRGAYAEVANRRRTIPEAVVLGMLDPQLQVKKVTTPSGTRYVLEEDLEQLKEDQIVQATDTVIPAGELGRFSGRDMRMVYGFASHLASHRLDLAQALGVRATSLEHDPSLGDQWHAIRIDVKGLVTDQLAMRVQRAIENAVQGDGVNFVCLWLESPGGSPQASLQLASFLSGLDSSQIRTVAYIESEARADAALIALACDQLVMRHDAWLGGPGDYQPSGEEIADMRPPVQEVCRNKERAWSLPLAIVDPSLVVHRYTLGGTNVEQFFSEEELAEQPEPARWRLAERVTQDGAVLSVAGEKAAALGLARFAVGNYDEFKQLYHLEGDPALVEPNWADELVDYLAAPHVATTLLFFAGFALMVELTSPGIGAGAFVSAVCFVLFFWSQFLHGTATWLEFLLFITGLAFILLEVFVLPGLGIFGLGGAGLVVASVVLASQTFVLPRNAYQMQQLPRSLLTVVGAGAGIALGLAVLRKYFRRAPLLRRMMLDPPIGDELAELGRREALVDYTHLLNQIGVTTTPLVPAGKARFGGELVDVISDGEAVGRGQEVRVVDVSGNHVLVRPKQPELP